MGINYLIERIRIGLANKIYQYQMYRVVRKRMKYTRSPHIISKVCVYYRICDHGYAKNKPYYITKENCLANAVSQFPISEVEWHVLADNVSDETYTMILKYLPAECVKRVCVGSGAGTFRMVYDEALAQEDNALIYFLEDDYLHLNGSLKLLKTVAASGCSDYITLYDHPDKYSDKSQNPFVYGGGEKSKVLYIGNHHWKETNSTTMTFAAFVSTLKKDKNFFGRWTSTKHPFDFYIFTELLRCANRVLLSPIPSMSTHGETEFLALGIDWQECVKENSK